MRIGDWIADDPFLPCRRLLCAFPKTKEVNSFEPVKLKMEGSSDRSLSECVKLWKGAKSDNEKFAALMVITRLFNASTSDSSSRRLLFECIGFDFIDRLLKSPVPAECPSHIYLSLALSVLSAFATEEELARHSQMIQKVPLLVKCLEHSDEGIVSDSLQCLLALAGVESNCRHIVASDGAPALCRCACTSKAEGKVALKVVKCLIASGSLNSDDVVRCASEYGRLIFTLADAFQLEHGADKFSLADDLAFLLMYASGHTTDHRGHNTALQDALERNKVWRKKIRDGLYDVLRSHLAEELRVCAFALMVSLLGLCGAHWMLTDSGAAEKSSLFVLAPSLAAVEIRLHLGEDRDETKDWGELPSSTQAMILDCFRVVEAMITAMATFADANNFTDILSGEVILLLHRSITDALRAVLYFLSSLSEDDSSRVHHELSLGAARLVAVWAEEEVEMLRPELAACSNILRKIAALNPSNTILHNLQDL